MLDRVAGQVGGARQIEFLQRAKKLRKDELPLMARDAKLAPENAEIQYRYGLLLYLNGDNKAALNQLLLASELAPDDDRYQTAVRLLEEKMAE